MKRLTKHALAIAVIAFSPQIQANQLLDEAFEVYSKANLRFYMGFGVFAEAYKYHVKLADKPYLTIIDYSKPSNERRFFLIDTDKARLLYRTYVSHGINSGTLYATEFSNTINSRKTSLGAFKVANAYHGKHGLSLRLDGYSETNSNARERAIVLHGADYAAPSVISKIGMLGRSWGCPAIPRHLTETVVNLLKNGGTIYAHSTSS